MENRWLRNVDIYEKRISVMDALFMMKKGMIRFPNYTQVGRERKVNKISNSVEMMLTGLKLPVFYASELQSGDLLILDSSDILRYLFDFLEGRYRLRHMEMCPELENCSFEDLEMLDPRITSQIYDYPLQLQIVDYWAPTYFHIQIGKYVGSWSFAREQSVRNELYDEETLQYLNDLDKEIYKQQMFFSTNRLNRQYVFLRILMCHYVMNGEMEALSEYNPGLQIMLDWTLKRMSETSWKQLNKIRDELNEVSMILTEWLNADNYFGRHMLVEGRGKEIQVRYLTYIFNMIWNCLGDKYREEECRNFIIEELGFWKRVERDSVNYSNMLEHFQWFEERVR